MLLTLTGNLSASIYAIYSYCSAVDCELPRLYGRVEYTANGDFRDDNSTTLSTISTYNTRRNIPHEQINLQTKDHPSAFFFELQQNFLNKRMYATALMTCIK